MKIDDLMLVIPGQGKLHPRRGILDNPDWGLLKTVITM
jgi:hypothetical protein